MQNLIVINDAENKRWLKFTNPVKVIETDDVNKVISKFQEVEETVNNGESYAVGFLSYEAAPVFDPSLQTKTLQSLPLLWFAFYKEYEIIDLSPVHSTSVYLKNWSSSVSRKEYDAAIAKIKDHIREGDTYQVNYTMRQYADFSGNAWEFFKELSHTQCADYSAFIDTEHFTICSVSPELFFTYKNGSLTGCPMKGTAGRGLTFESDKQQADWLYHSIKDRAENLMIIDMIRNDFGRIAEPGSIDVGKLFNIEKYPTVWQMTSMVKADTKAGIVDIMKALFPCASITGAPKANTMKIISELENTPRGIYTGTIGFITPEKRAQFNVAIRTVVIDKASNTAEYGVGGGIVWDSTDKGEYDECQIKTKVLTERQPDFSLLKSILWMPEQGYFLLEYHLKWLLDSAEYFDFAVDIKKVELCLRKKEMDPAKKIRYKEEKFCRKS
jgi:para-aminobenzoate synthetase / 4-amino-4-deoxychorismate lyase